MPFTEDTDPYCLAPDEADRLLRDAPWRRFVVMGDSIAEGLGEDSPGYQPLSWYERVSAALRRQRPDLVATNLGRRDLRAADVRATQLEAALAFRPDLAVLVAGGNDLFGRQFQPERVEAELDAMVGALRAVPATVVTITLMDIVRAVPQLAGGPMERLPVLNERVRAVSERHGALVLDAFAHPMCADRDVYSSDFKHATRRGHAILGAELIRLLGARIPSLP